MEAPRKPRALKPGDTIAMVSPASPIEPERTATCIAWLETHGFKVKLMPHVYDADFFLAGTDQDRAKDLQDAFADPESAAVFCSRGGYGCARLFPYLDLDKIAQSQKMFLGFSDVTTLHLALNRRGLKTVHAPMALSLHYERDPWVFDSLLKCLQGQDPIVDEAPKGKTIIGGKAQGGLTGGCLILINDSIGTPDAFECDGKIVLIEDVDENPHRIDAMLTQLLNTGIIQKANGIVVGEMTRTDEKADESIGAKPWRAIVEERLKPLGKPMIFDYPFGHCKNMLTLPLGLQVELDADAGTLRYLEPLCE